MLLLPLLLLPLGYRSGVLLLCLLLLMNLVC